MTRPQPTQPPTTKFSYTFSTQGFEAGVQIVPRLSADLVTFPTVREMEDVLLRRTGNLVEILTPDTNPRLCLKLTVDDPLP